MSHQYRVRNHEEIHFVTFTIVDWIDVFIRPSYKQLIIDSFIYCQKNKGLEIYAFCLMTNHLHLLVSARSPVRLPDIVRDFKKHTNKQIIKLIKEENESRRDRIQNYKVWRDGYHSIECDREDILFQKLDYIHDNPVRAEIVSYPEHYIYSSAINYAGERGLLEVTLLERGFISVKA
jgi:REP element-mobilizing transposase RayT